VRGEPWSDRKRRRAATAVVGALCAFYFLAALWITRDHYPAPPDTLHNAIVARNLVRGNGFKINMINHHVGRFADVEHVAEMHGMLQPLALAGLFALAGPVRAMFRVPGFLYVALAGFVTFVYARRVFGTGAGLVACALTLSSSLLWLWAWFGTDDAGFAFWFLVALFALDVAIEKRSSQRFAIAGLAAAFALLQKLSGLILLAPLLAITLDRGAPARSRRRWAAIWLVPWSLALALNVVRNRIATGGWTFRFGPIGWIYKAYGLEPYFGVYDPMPSMGSVLSRIGSERLVSIVLGQLGDFARAALSPTPMFSVDPLNRLMAPGFLSLVGLAALAFHARRRPRFATLSALSLLGAVGFVCGVWHYETRYFSLLVPLLAISIAGAIVTAWPAAPMRRNAAFALAAAGVGLASVGLAVWVFAVSLRAVPLFGGPIGCQEAFYWIGRETAPSDRILTFDPWSISWATERASIVIPSGSRSDVERVVAWYDPVWLVVTPEYLRQGSVHQIREMLANPTAAFSASPVFLDGDCAIYRITRPASGPIRALP